MNGGDPKRPVVEAGRNCWRIARADRAAVIVDACDYFHVARQAMEKARHRILLIGWDFDARIQLERTEDGRQGQTLGAFLLEVVQRRPEIAIDILKWDVGALRQFGRVASLLMLGRWAMTPQIRLRFDGAHPTGGSHHQKIVVIDGSFAVCGGIDMTGDRRDTSVHRDDDPCRRRPAGQPHGAWHDVTMVVDGAAARALAELAHDRWQVATGDDLPVIAQDNDPWPDDLVPQFRDVDLAISRTRAEYGELAEVREIEALWLDLIADAKRFLYIENQYFTNGKLAAAIARRMQEPHPPEIVMINPIRADGWLEQKAMDRARERLVRAIEAIDTSGRFRIYTPKTRGGDDIHVHAKVMIVDDRVLRIGSSNMNNRSLGLDSECDLALDCRLPGNADCAATIAAIRTRLLAEHLGIAEAAVTAKLDETASLIETIEALRGHGKTLAPLILEDPGAVEALIAENASRDSEQPEELFEAPARRGLFRRWRL